MVGGARAKSEERSAKSEERKSTIGLESNRDHPTNSWLAGPSYLPWQDTISVTNKKYITNTLFKLHNYVWHRTMNDWCTSTKIDKCAQINYVCIEHCISIKHTQSHWHTNCCYKKKMPRHSGQKRTSKKTATEQKGLFFGCKNRPRVPPAVFNAMSADQQKMVTQLIERYVILVWATDSHTPALKASTTKDKKKQRIKQ